MRKELVLGWVLVGMGMTANAGLPFNALRMGQGVESPENWPEFFSALINSRPAFDEIWFSTGCRYPKMEYHRIAASNCAERAEQLRRICIHPSIEIQTTIGHSDDHISKDASGQTWSTWVSWTGEAAKHCACPRDPKLHAYFAEVAALHAAWRPEVIFIDDDLAIKNRGPVSATDRTKQTFGCFCERCLADFAKVEGRVWDRAALVDKIYAERELPGGMRQRWTDFQVSSLCMITKAISEAVHRVSPETRMGYQYGMGLPEVAKVMAETTGHGVRIRPGSGAYWDVNPRDQLSKAYELAASKQPVISSGCVEAMCPEIESCPSTFFSRTPQGVILEMFENLTLGADFLSMAVARYSAHEEMDFFFKDLFPRIGEAVPMLKRYRDLNRGAKPAGLESPWGIHPYMVERGLPIMPRGGLKLGDLPDPKDLPVTKGGSNWLFKGSEESHHLLLMSGPYWRKWVKAADEATGGRLPCVFREPVRAFAMPHITEAGELKTLAVINTSIDRMNPVKALLRGVPAGARVVYWNIVDDVKTLELKWLNERECEVELPRLDAWQFGYLSFGLPVRTSSEYSMTVNGKSVHVVEVPKPQFRSGPPKWQEWSPYSYSVFTADEEVSVTVRSEILDLSKVRILPDSKGVKPESVAKNEVKFRMKPGMTLALEPNGDRHHALIVSAANKDEAAPSKGDRQVKYFCPGFHRAGEIRLGDGETAYFAPGAWVEGHIIAKGRNIKVAGSGVLSGANHQWGLPPKMTGEVPSIGGLASLSGENIVVKDTTFFSSYGWTLVLNYVTNAVVDNVKIIGSRVINDDGIDVCRAKDVIVRNSFVRCQDDCLAPKYWCQNLVATNLTIWTDAANALRLGYECMPKATGLDYRNLVFKDIDVLHLTTKPSNKPSNYWTECAILLQAAFGQTMGDILIEDWRFHEVAEHDIFFNAKTMGISQGGPTICTKEPGIIDGVIVRNVNVPKTERGMTVNFFEGDKEHPIRNVKFENVTGYNGQCLD